MLVLKRKACNSTYLKYLFGCKLDTDLIKNKRMIAFYGLSVWSNRLKILRINPKTQINDSSNFYYSSER